MLFFPCVFPTSRSSRIEGSVQVADASFEAFSGPGAVDVVVMGLGVSSPSTWDWWSH